MHSRKFYDHIFLAKFVDLAASLGVSVIEDQSKHPVVHERGKWYSIVVEILTKQIAINKDVRPSTFLCFDRSALSFNLVYHVTATLVDPPTYCSFVSGQIYEIHFGIASAIPIRKMT